MQAPRETGTTARVLHVESREEPCRYIASQSAQIQSIHGRSTSQIPPTGGTSERAKSSMMLSLEVALVSLEEGMPPQPSVATFACILYMCRKEINPAYALLLHAHMCKIGLDAHRSLGNELVPVLVDAGHMWDAQQVFDMLVLHNECSWSSLITGYIRCGESQHALMLYQKMQEDSIHPSAHIFVALLKACAKLKDLEQGGEIHADIARKGLLERDPFIGSALVDMYAKCGSFAKAREVFDELPIRGVVPWTALIAGYTKHGRGEEALHCFERMQLEGVSADAATFICSLKACRSIGATHKGQQIHDQIVRKGLERDLRVGSTLVDMYASCGFLGKAQEVFDKLPVQDVVSWTALIAGYAKYDYGNEALSCFEKMQLEGIPPNTVTFVCSLKACSSIEAIDKGREIHAEISRKGLLERDVAVGNALVDMYAKCGLLAKAQEVFDKLPARDAVSWNALMAGYVKHEQCEEALDCYEQMHLEGVSPNSVTFVCSLKACGSIGAIGKGQEIHAEIDRQGLERDLLVGSALVDMYANCGLLVKAREVFDKLPAQDVVSWTALIAGYVKQGCCEEALRCFEQMQLKGISPNAVTFVYSLKACGSIGATDKGQEIHTEIARKRLLETDLTIGNALVEMYTECGLLSKAQEVFDKLSARDAVSWNTLIAGCAKRGHGEKALKYYEQMHLDGISPNAFTYVCSLKACGSIGAADKGQEIHAEITRKGVLGRDLVVGNALVDMYANCGLLSKAQDVFNILPVRDVVSWNALITGYAKHEHDEEALNCFEQMQLEGVAPDSVTFVSSLKACGSTRAIDKVQKIHTEIARNGIMERDLVVGNALVDTYVKCGSLAKAKEVFTKLPVRDVISWNTLIAGYANWGCGEEALNCFEQMQLEGISPNTITFLCTLKACSSIGATDKGQEIHADIAIDGLLEGDLAVGNVLVDMYAKCGLLAKAQEVFDKLPVQDVVSWTALLAGYAQLGDHENVFHIFDRMREEGKMPNPVTFCGVINACSHAGRVDKGERYFVAMSKDYGIDPTLEQYTCMVDLLGRAGQLEKAMAMLKQIPFHPDLVVWNIMLGACRKWGNVELGRQAFEHAVCLDEKDAAAYVCMRNIYADADMQEEANKVEAMRVKNANLEEARTYLVD